MLSSVSEKKTEDFYFFHVNIKITPDVLSHQINADERLNHIAKICQSPPDTQQ
jgi:hypothetical protein